MDVRAVAGLCPNARDFLGLPWLLGCVIVSLAWLGPGDCGSYSAFEPEREAIIHPPLSSRGL